ncbi:hypothetical protein Poli38472_000007 [Pythium oligandrum]|uniref:Pumilio domain-containing protein NOP9 n=1 Tax=Pythium oligandrum TaxID=41045 RepID=A0A8K1CBA7_PYTOL|nr:hypothetical protein Poli38472_000007 [Pythium oligandrum]|eukprot:TMW59965.1 hypothetical protein Poli38472_000007 [Pythium oligandrum]
MAPQDERSNTESGQRSERLRPRRLEPDTLSYLKEVSETLATSSEDLGEEDVQMMLWNVLDEMAPRAASASSDRHAGELIETFLPRMSDGQLRFFLSKMEGYFSHLWTNRYSSHVLQHILSRSNVIVEKEVTGESDDSEDERLEGTPLMSEVIVNMVSEVENEWLTLMNDVSASHVLRSVLAVLVGRPLVPEKRGKKGKHRTIVFGEQSDGSTPTFEVPATFEALYQQFVRRFRGAHKQEMMNLMYDRNSGPLIAAMLKLSPEKTQTTLAEHILEWEDESRSAQVFYDFAGDAVTSHFIESFFSVAKDDFFAAVFRRCVQGKMLEFAEHSIANYVIQNAIQRVNTSDLALEVLEELGGSLWTLLSMGRAGVVWRLVEMCRRAKVHEQEIFTSVVEAVKKQESKKPEAAQKQFVPALLGLQLTTNGNNKVQLNVMGAKILAEFIQMEYAEWLKPLYTGILDLNVAQILALAMDSTGSRSLIEPIWETNDSPRAWVRKALYEKFVGHFSTLALDRLGAFSVIKCYEMLALKEKAVVAEELLQVEGKLSGSHFAQLVMNTVNLYEFRNNREKWEALHEKKDKIADMFKDMVDNEGAAGKKRKSKKQTTEASGDDKTHRRDKKKHKKSKESETTEDVDVIMGALRGSLEATKSKKKRKNKNKYADN